MIGRIAMLAIICACGCSKPAGTPVPRRAGDPARQSGGWTIVRTQALDEDASEDDGGLARERDDGEAASAGRDDGNAATRADGTPASDEAGQGDDGGVGAREPATPTRTPIVPASHPEYARLEGDGLANTCKRDGECTMGGCAREVCSAQQGVTTTCDVLPVQLPTDAACGCVAGECVWYSRTGTTLPVPKREGPQPNVGEAPNKQPLACGRAVCKPGQQCLQYYGIAGTNGPRFESCEWPCSKGQRCPKGTTCTTIADGPGKVCR
jgi:hypothetical protein